MRKTLLAGIAGILSFLLVVGLLASGKPSVVAEEPTAEPTAGPTTYTLYVPLVLKSPEVTGVYPLDWCSCAMFQGVAGTGDGIRCACASARGPDSQPEMLRAGSGRAPSPYGGYGTYAGRSFLLFPDGPENGAPVLHASRVFVGGINAARCWVDVHAFSLPVAWTMPFTITPEMWGMVGPLLGSVVVDNPQEDTQEITLTIPLSGFSRTMVVLSRCETYHELCALDPYRYSWNVSGLDVVLEWPREEFQP